MSSHMPDEKTDGNGAQAERARLGPSLLLCGKTFRGTALTSHVTL